MKRRRNALVAIVSTLAIAAGVGAAAQPADAAASSYLQSVIGTTSCNSANRTMTLGVQVTLSLAYPYGLNVAYHFRYYQVDAGGNRTSAIYGGNWLGPYFIDTWTPYFDPISGGTGQASNPASLNGGNIVWAGRLHAQVELAVWTGSSYSYTGWMDINRYTNYYPTSLGMQSTTLSDCLTAW